MSCELDFDEFDPALAEEPGLPDDVEFEEDLLSIQLMGSAVLAQLKLG